MVTNLTSLVLTSLVEREISTHKGLPLEGSCLEVTFLTSDNTSGRSLMARLNYKKGVKSDNTTDI